jgi:hypothetical protein
MNESVEMARLDLWLPEAGEFFAPPEAEGFDPAGAWEHVYAALENHPSLEGRRIRHKGYLSLRRTPGAGGRFAFSVEHVSAGHRGGGVYRTLIEMECACDRLASPVSWTTSTASLDHERNPIEWTTLEDRGRITDGRAEWDPPRTGRPEPASDGAGAPLTSDWSLVEAVQRLGRLDEALEFDVLEDLDLVRPAQRLVDCGEAKVDLGAGPVGLRGYRRTGEGILPHYCWLDGGGRVLFMYAGLRGFLFNMGAPEATA